jgi:hypothetical protein
VSTTSALPNLERHQAAGAAAWACATSLLFALRVAGQAIQRWVPQSFLPPFAAFQGSRLPYPVLLAAQLAILAAMVVSCRRVLAASQTRSRRKSMVLTWMGAVYLTLSVLRIAIGVALPAAPAWFRAWISEFFHLVLAAFVLSLARCYRSPPP